MDEARSVRDFWFGRTPLTAEALTARMRFWFGSGASQLAQRRDEHIRVRFGPLLERAAAFDDQALALTLSGMQSAADAALNVVERVFFYMPLQHAERAEVQDESVAAYRRLLGEASEDLHAFFGSALRSAENHRSIIERFGRFPHRNRALERTSTPQEEDWLRQGGESFGQ